LKLRWTPSAEQDRRDIFDFIAADNPRAAAQMDELFRQAAARLARFPHLGRPGRVPETRELVAHERYILVYEIDDDTV
jgi:addiction module RelE/StbE family toxin